MEILEDGHDRPLSRKFLRQSLPASRADRDDVSFYVRVAVDRSLTDPAKNHGVPPRYLNSVRQGFRSSELFSPRTRTGAYRDSLPLSLWQGNQRWKEALAPVENGGKLLRHGSACKPDVY